MTLRVMVGYLIVILALIDDFRRFKISNKIIGLGLLAAGALCLWDFVQKEEVINYLVSGVVVFVLMLLVYAFSGVGAADVKLCGVLGIILGSIVMWKVIMVAFVYTGIVGSIMWITGKCRKIKTKYGEMHIIRFSQAILAGMLCVNAGII